jgi:hypothetical protein
MPDRVQKEGPISGIEMTTLFNRPSNPQQIAAAPTARPRQRKQIMRIMSDKQMACELSLVFSDLVDGRITQEQAVRQYDIHMGSAHGKRTHNVILDLLNHQFVTGIVSLIALISVIVTLDGIDSDRPVSRHTLYFNYFAAVFFAAECGARMFAMGVRKYLSSLLCMLELLVTILDAIIFAILTAYGNNYKRIAQLGRTVRVIRLLRIIRLVRLARFVGQHGSRLLDAGSFLKQPRLFKRVRKCLFQNRAKVKNATFTFACFISFSLPTGFSLRPQSGLILRHNCVLSARKLLHPDI